MTANELAAIAMEPSGAISMVAATMALFIAISCTATGTPILNAVFRIFASKTVFSFRRRRSRGLRTQQNQAPVRLMTAQASIVPIPAPMTPKTGIKRALKMTSSTHMTAFKILGVTISPLHCRKDDISELSWENGRHDGKHHKIERGIPPDLLRTAEPPRAADD